MTELGPGEHAWQLLLPGTRVRVKRAVHPELPGATGVLGMRVRNDLSRPPPRVLVRISAPPEAVAAFPRGVFLPMSDLAAAPGDDVATPNDDDDEGAAADDHAGDAARDAREATRLAFVAAMGLGGMQESCGHGAPWATSSLFAAEN